MSRPPLEVADIIRAAGDAFIERNRHWLGWKHVKVLLAMARCRTAALGGHLDECTRCGYRAISFNRVAISNHRLVSFADGQVTFRWRDSADGNKQKLLPLSVNEFLTRFLLHILPQGFVRIRHFGFLANRRRTTLLPLCFQLLGSTPEPPAEEHP